MLKIFEKLAALPEKDGYLVLSEDDCRKIEGASRKIISEVGFKVMHPGMQKILQKKGYRMNGEVVKVAPAQIENLLESIPRPQVIKEPKEGKIFVGYFANQIYDAQTDTVRYPTKKDLDQATIVGLSLPEVARVNPLFEPKDLPKREDILMLDVMLRRVENTRRNEIHNKSSISVMMEMCQVVSGSKKDVLRKEMLIYYAFLISPLRYDFETLELALVCLDEGLPVRFGTPMTIAGATGPVTLAGTLALTLAESYTGLILADATGQKWEPGCAPVVMDQTTGATLYCGPDKALLSMAVGDLLRYLGFGGGIGHLTQSDECKPGIQAGIEKAYTAMLFLLAGLPPTINNAGELGPGGLVGSIEQIVIDAEVISILNRMVRGIEVNEETIAFELIKKVGLEGNYLSEEHTARHFRKELWFPTIIKRLNPSAWNVEKPDMLKEAKKRVTDILSSCNPKAITREQEEKLDEILERNGINTNSL